MSSKAERHQRSLSYLHARMPPPLTKLATAIRAAATRRQQQLRAPPASVHILSVVHASTQIRMPRRALTAARDHGCCARWSSNFDCLTAVDGCTARRNGLRNDALSMAFLHKQRKYARSGAVGSSKSDARELRGGSAAHEGGDSGESRGRGCSAQRSARLLRGSRTPGTGTGWALRYLWN